MLALQKAAQIGWESAQRGELVDGDTAIAQIRANLRVRHASNMSPQFRLTQPAVSDIEEIADYIASQSGFEQADRFLSKLKVFQHCSVS